MATTAQQIANRKSFRDGKDSIMVSGRTRSMSATSFSRTTILMKMMSRSSQAATERTTKIWDQLNELFLEERKKGVLDISQIPEPITAHGPGYIDQAKRSDRWFANRRAAQAIHHAKRRLADGAQRTEDIWIRARSTHRRSIHEISKDP